MSDEPTLYLIDDDAAVRDSIDILLQCYGIAVRAFSSGAAFLRDLPAISGGCLLIDINARGANGLELLDQHEGAENWATLASLIETCKLHDINPEAYLADVLTKLVNNWPNNRLAELTPWAWAADHR